MCGCVGCGPTADNRRQMMQPDGTDRGGMQGNQWSGCMGMAVNGVVSGCMGMHGGHYPVHVNHWPSLLLPCNSIAHCIAHSMEVQDIEWKHWMAISWGCMALNGKHPSREGSSHRVLMRVLPSFLRFCPLSFVASVLSFERVGSRRKNGNWVEPEDGRGDFGEMK